MGCLLWVQSMWCMFCNWNCHTVSYNYHVKIEGVKTRPNSTELISPGHEGATASSSELELKYWSRWKQNHTPLIKQNVSPEIQDLCNHSPLIKIYIIKDLDYKTCNTDPSSTPAPFDNAVHFFSRLCCICYHGITTLYFSAMISVCNYYQIQLQIKMVHNAWFLIASWCILLAELMVKFNYTNPIYGVASICHQVRWLRWGHPILFHTATSLLIWYKMFCVRDISYRLIWMEFVNMFSMHAQSEMHSRFNW